MIIGLTHDKEGQQVLRRSITTKIAIGLPPDDKTKYPTRLDHFIFQRKAVKGSGNSKEVAWEIDQERTAHYGKECREVWIVFLDDDPEQVFRTEYAVWTRTQCFCRGNGDVAIRKTKAHPEGETWSVCANSGRCPEMEGVDNKPGICKPSGDLYFMLADFPTLGTICKLHTSSYQSIREISTALADLRMVTGGRLMGVKARLSVRTEKNVYTDAKTGNLMSSTKQVIGLELAASDILQLTNSLTDTALMFDKVKLRLGARSVVIEEEDEEAIAPAMNHEFYPNEENRPAEGKVIEGAVYKGTIDGTSGKQVVEMKTEQDRPIDRAEARTFHQAWQNSGKNEKEVREYLDSIGAASSLQIPKSKWLDALKWAETKPTPAPAEEIDPNMSAEEKKVHEAFGVLGVALADRRALIDQYTDQDLIDWDGIADELSRRADAAAAGA